MSKLFKSFSFVFLIVGLLMPSVSVAQQNINLPKINYKEFKLKNGLTVVFHQDKSTPIVAVNVWYHVGSKNETPRKTGFAHLFEHMMFQGSKNYSDGYLSAVSEIGGDVNGTTDGDRTWYYEVVPSNFLERALFLEADRMGGLLDAMTQEKLDNQRDVVKNERRLRVDNQPYGTLSERIGNIMYPEGHPYHWPVIGSMEDLSAATLDDVRGFFRLYYAPNNAVLVLTGDFDENLARTWIEKYFGPIAKGTNITRPNPLEPKLNGEIRKTYEDSVPLPLLSIVWHTTPAYTQDEAALDILSSILSSGRGSRLQSELVYGKELAQQANAFNSSSELAGLFQIRALAKPGKSLDYLEKAINEEVERIKREPPTTDEMTRALNAQQSRAIFGLQRDFGKGAKLSSYAGYLNKPDYFQTDLDRYLKVTAADVQRVASKYLTSNRLVISYVPRKGEAPKQNPNDTKTSTTGAKRSDADLIARQRAALPKPGTNPKLTLPKIEKMKLPNGLNIWLVKQSELPIVSMNLVFNAGATLDPADKSGVSSMTASMLNKGTTSRSALEIANQLQFIGATIGAGSDWDSTNVTLSTLTKNLDSALGIYSDVVLNASFPVNEFETLRRRQMVDFVQIKASPGAISRIIYNKVLYGDQTYGHDLEGDESSVKAMTRDDLITFYQANYRPNEATLIVVGDIDKKTIMPKLEKAFGTWKAGKETNENVENQTMVGKAGIYLIDKPGAAQSTVAIGQVGTSRDNPDYYALQVMNAILGGSSSARLFMNLRENKGYTYGAYSSFSFRRGAGPFRATGDIQTVSTKESIVEFMKELNGIRGSIPVTPQELESNKQRIIRGYPSDFETVGDISVNLADLVVYGLPDTYFNDYIQKINAVTVQDVNRVANKYLDPTKMVVVVVGDRKVIEPRLKELDLPITILDPDGNAPPQ